MTGVQIPQEVIIAAGGVIIALLAFLAWSMRHLASFAQALKAHADVNITLNQSLKESYDERRAMETERRTMREDLDQLLAAQRAVEEQRQALLDEITTLKRQTGEDREREAGDIVRLQGRITTLEREREDLIARVSLLEAERDGLKGERELLLTKVAELTTERDQQKVQIDNQKTQIDNQKVRIDRLEAQVETLEKKGTTDGTATTSELAGPLADAGDDSGHLDPAGVNPVGGETHDPAGEGRMGNVEAVQGESDPGGGSAERSGDPVVG